MGGGGQQAGADGALVAEGRVVEYELPHMVAALIFPAEQYGAARVVEHLAVLRQGRLSQVGEGRARERQPRFLAARTGERVPDQSWFTKHYPEFLLTRIDAILK